MRAQHERFWRAAADRPKCVPRSFRAPGVYQRAVDGPIPLPHPTPIKLRCFTDSGGFPEISFKKKEKNKMKKKKKKNAKAFSLAIWDIISPCKQYSFVRCSLLEAEVPVLPPWQAPASLCCTALVVPEHRFDGQHQKSSRSSVASVSTLL